MSKSRYFGRRIAYAVLLLILVISFNFILFRMMPGDPARLLLPRGHYQESVIEANRKALHLDKPLWQQFGYYWADTVQLEFGTSFVEKRPVSTVLAERIGPTVLLMGAGLLVATVLGSISGVFAAWRRGRAYDVTSTGLGMVFYSMPSFWFALILILIFAVKLGWFPVGRMTDPGVVYAHWYNQVGSVLHHMVLPVFTLAVIFVGEFHIIMRSSILGVMKEDFVLTARAKGLAEKAVLWRHVVPNGMLPTVTVIMLSLGFMMSGSIVDETVYNWPGLGLLAYDSITKLDYPVMQGVFLLSAVAVIFFNLVADIVYYYMDPRVQA